jgi:hypothetical protein
VSASGVPARCPVQVSGPGVRDRCPAQVSVSGVPARCPVQVSVPGVCARCPVQVSVLGVRSRCPCYANSIWETQISLGSYPSIQSRSRSWLGVLRSRRRVGTVTTCPEGPPAPTGVRGPPRLRRLSLSSLHDVDVELSLWHSYASRARPRLGRLTHSHPCTKLVLR